MKRLWGSALTCLAWLSSSPVAAEPLRFPWDPDWSQVAPERRLVRLRPVTFGYEAEVAPEFDTTLCLPQRFKVEGLDSKTLAGVSLAEGFPVRLRGRFSGDRVKVDTGAVGSEPALLPLPTNGQAWRGLVASQGISLEPARARIEVDGKWVEVALQFDRASDRQAWSRSWQRCWLRLTCWREGERWVAADCQLAASPPAPSPGPAGARFVAQTGELFLDSLSSAFRKHNASRFVFRDPLGASQLAVDRFGLTLQNCPPGQVRLFGHVSGKANLPATSLGPAQALQVVEGEWEVVAKLAFSGQNLKLQPRPETMQVRLTRPLYLEMSSWSQGIAQMLARVVSPELILPVPGAYSKELLDSGVFTQAELERWRVATYWSGDRRSSYLSIAGPDLGKGRTLGLHSRLPQGRAFALALAPEAINRALSTQIGRSLPLRQEVPADMRNGPRFLFLTLKLEAVEITRLQLSYTRLGEEGLFSLDDCIANVHWRLGPLSGVEPGAQAKGYARVSAEGSPLALSASTDIQYLEFLSPRIRQQSPQEQQLLREQLVGGLRQMKLRLPFTPTLPLPPLGPSAALQLQGLRSLPEEFVLQGGLAGVSERR